MIVPVKPQRTEFERGYGACEVFCVVLFMLGRGGERRVLKMVKRKKKSFALRAARKMINITESNSICINYTAIQGIYTNLSNYL